MISLADVCWVAGVVDALGNIKVRETDAGSELPCVQISTAKVPLVRRLAELTGVKVVEVTRKYDRLGCSLHCDEPHMHVFSKTGRWELTGVRARIVLKTIRPYMVIQGEVVDHVLGETLFAPFKSATERKMRELGWGTEDV